MSSDAVSVPASGNDNDTFGHIVVAGTGTSGSIVPCTTGQWKISRRPDALGFDVSHQLVGSDKPQIVARSDTSNGCIYWAPEPSQEYKPGVRQVSNFWAFKLVPGSAVILDSGKMTAESGHVMQSEKGPTYVPGYAGSSNVEVAPLYGNDKLKFQVSV